MNNFPSSNGKEIKNYKKHKGKTSMFYTAEATELVCPNRETLLYQVCNNVKQPMAYKFLNLNNKLKYHILEVIWSKEYPTNHMPICHCCHIKHRCIDAIQMELTFH